MKKQYFITLFIFYSIAVFYLAITTPITEHEATIFYTQENVVSFLMHQGKSLIGDIFGVFLGLRIFFVSIGLLSIFLFYTLSKQYLSKVEDRYLATTIFMLLPGIVTATTLANISMLVLALVLLFVLLYEKGIRYPLPLIMLALFFIHKASILFFVALLIYGLIYKDKKLAIGAMAFLLAFLYLSKGITIGGRPSGHFAEIFGLYATVFSPLLFLYFFYAMYRILLREEKGLLWFISFTALAFSLLLSLRQRVYITDFAPYVMISIIPMLELLNNSVRVRLPEFQKYYKRGFYIVIIVLLLNTSLIFFHKILYMTSENRKEHFANRIYHPYTLANQLHAQGLDCIEQIKRRENYQLKYYHILPCNK